MLIKTPKRKSLNKILGTFDKVIKDLETFTAAGNTTILKNVGKINKLNSQNEVIGADIHKAFTVKTNLELLTQGVIQPKQTQE